MIPARRPVQVQQDLRVQVPRSEPRLRHVHDLRVRAPPGHGLRDQVQTVEVSGTGQALRPASAQELQREDDQHKGMRLLDS